MPRGKHEFRRPRGIRALIVVLAAGIPLAVVAAGLSLPTRASASGTTAAGKGTTTDITINIPAMVVDNLCNADVVNLSGDLRIITTTKPTGNGGYTVRSTAIARGLRGNRIAPPPPIGYHGDDGENTFTYFAPPPYPSTSRVVHWTRLVPEAPAPSMYLVLVIRETILADGSMVPVFERAFLVCRQPTCSAKHV
jgi:hypothetical protein